MDANEGVQSFNFEVGKKLSHLRNLRANINITKMQNLYNCSVCKIDVHLYASIVCDGCLEWNHLKCATKIHVLAMQTVLYNIGK